MKTDIFKQSLRVMERYEDLISRRNMCDISEDEIEFLYNVSIYFAQALFNEIPQIEYVTKHLQIMLEERGLK